MRISELKKRPIFSAPDNNFFCKASKSNLFSYLIFLLKIFENFTQRATERERERESYRVEVERSELVVETSECALLEDIFFASVKNFLSLSSHPNTEK